MPERLTDLERSIYDYLVDYLRRNTYQPSIREIGQAFRIKSTKTVSELLQALADKGWVERDASRSRGVRLLGLDAPEGTVAVPWLDKTPDQERLLGALQFDRKLVPGAGTFMVAMPDDSLRGEGIRAGDLLLMEPVRAGATVAGEVVLARRDDTAIVRRLVRRDGALVLEADGTPPLPVGPRVQLEGRLRSVVRRVRAPEGEPAPA